MERVQRTGKTQQLRVIARSGLIVLIAASVATDAMLAQQIDPRVLQQMQGALGSAGPGSSSGAALDRSREAGADPSGQDGAPLLPGGVTSDEVELRRQRSQRLLRSIYQPSPIERDYRARLNDPELRQFGYDLFRSTTTTGPLTGAVSDTYVLGVGDELVVSFQGAVNQSQTLRVDREGRLVVGQLRPIRAAGRSLGAVRADLAAETRRTLLGTDVYVSLGSVRAITVFVGGEVERPGQYQLTSLSDVATALARAGGIRRTGSLRQVRVVRAGGGTAVVDLYGLLGIGAPPGIRLQDGDRIVVPVIGPTAAIAGNVARPAIYELRGSVSVGELLDYAGGALRPRGYRIAISRITAQGTESFTRVSSESDRIVAGDAVQVIGGSAGGVANRVTLRGFVLNQGPRPLATARTVRELVGEPEELQLGTYMPMSILVRRDPVTSARVFQPVNLVTALRDAPAVPLQSDDRLYIFSQGDIDFMNSAPVRQIVLGQRNPLPQCRSLVALHEVVRDTQSSRLGAVVRGAFTVRRGEAAELVGTGSLLSQRGTAQSIEGLRTTRDTNRRAGTNRPSSEAEARQRDGNGAIDADEAAALGAAGIAAGTLDSAEQLDGEETMPGVADSDYQRATPTRSLARPRAVACPRVFEELPELLPVLVENAVVVGGSVRRPAAYPVAGELSAEALVAVAGGPVANSRDVVLDITRTSGSGATERYDAAKLPSLAAINVRPGDDLRFNAAQPQVEFGAVLLSGEFARPGLYSIRKGETLSQLIARAGGLTPLSYAYGAVFTRQSVKEQQQEGQQRTARELNTSLLAAMTRRAQSGDAMSAAADLIDRLVSIEPVGRMTVEADPMVLARRPDLDTVLEAGDAIFMPKTPNYVLTLGDVNNPGALQFVAGKSAGQYLAEAGGLQRTADDDRMFLVLPDGRAQPVRSSRWRRGGVVIPPGSTIIVPKNIDPLRSLDFVRDITQVLSQVATTVASLVVLSRN